MSADLTDPRPAVLVLDEWVPFPPDSGKRIRTYELLRALAAEFRICILAHEDPGARDADAHLREVGIEVARAPGRLPRKRGFGFLLRLGANACSPLPYSVWSHLRRGYAKAVAAALPRFQLVHSEWTPYAAYLEEPPVPWCVAAHNVESQIWARSAASAPAGPLRAYLRLQARRMERFERAVFRRAPWATACTEEDARTLRAWGCPQVVVVPNGVDSARFHPTDPARREPRTLVFTASMDSRPNQDAVRWFVEAVDPLLRRTAPYHLLVVGRDPPEELRQAARHLPHVEFTGTVADVRPMMARASAAVVPLRIGGGSRLKILEAMAAGVPVVSTRVGAEGLDLVAGTHLALGDTAEEFASAVERTLLGGEAVRRCVERSLDLVRTRYAWGDLARLQATVWRQALSSRGAPR